jgi:bacillopeptidase F (M6 metalloprotease family)
LTNGSHTLKLKVWDNANNSTTAIIRFIVGNELIISNIHNFPNPFSDQTGFVITHNRYNEWVDVSLEIMDLTGRKVESSSQRLVSAGYEVKDLFWVPRKRSSAQENGVYIYRITVTDKEGQRASKSGRIIWKK